MAPKTGPDYFPGQRSHLENSKTRVRTGTSLEELPGRWLPRAYLGGVRSSKTESSGLGCRRPVQHGLKGEPPPGQPWGSGEEEAGSAAIQGLFPGTVLVRVGLCSAESRK